MPNNRVSDEAARILEAVQATVFNDTRIVIDRRPVWEELVEFIRRLESELKETKRDLRDVIGPPTNEDAASGRLYLAAREFVEYYKEYYKRRDVAKSTLIVARTPNDEDEVSFGSIG